CHQVAGARVRLAAAAPAHVHREGAEDADHGSEQRYPEKGVPGHEADRPGDLERQQQGIEVGRMVRGDDDAAFGGDLLLADAVVGEQQAEERLGEGRDDAVQSGGPRRIQGRDRPVGGFPRGTTTVSASRRRSRAEGDSMRTSRIRRGRAARTSLAARTSARTRSAAAARRRHSRGADRSRTSTWMSSPRRLRRKTDANGSTVEVWETTSTMLPAGSAWIASRSAAASSRWTISSAAFGAIADIRAS